MNNIDELLNGKMTISRVSSNTEDDYIHVEIIFVNKHVTGKMTLENYAKMISGMARIPIEIENI